MTDHISRSELDSALATLRSTVTVPGPTPAHQRALLRAFDELTHTPPGRSWGAWATAAALAMLVGSLHFAAQPGDRVPDTADAVATREPSAFVTWPGAEQYPSFDSASLVRVHLPSQVVIQLGLPLADSSAVDIATDVLVGPDGLARAVRLAASPSSSTDPHY